MYAIISISSFTSLVSCAVILYIYYHYPKTRSVYGSDFVIILQALDLLVSITALIPTPLWQSQHSLCTAQGFILHALPNAQMLWTALMSIELYFSLRNNKKMFSIKWSLSIIMIVSIISAAVPFADKEYEQTGPWCYFRDKLLRLILFYSIMFFIQLWNLVWMKLFFMEYAARNSTSAPDFIHLRRRINLYPLIGVVCYLPLTVVRIMQFAELDIPDWCIIIACFSFRLTGFLNALVYNSTNEIQAILNPKKKTLVANLSRE